MEEGGVWQIFIDAAHQGWDKPIVRSGYGSSAHYANPLHSFLFNTGFEFPTPPSTSSDFDAFGASITNIQIDASQQIMTKISICNFIAMLVKTVISQQQKPSPIQYLGHRSWTEQKDKIPKSRYFLKCK